MTDHPTAQATEPDLEAAIDKVGRDRVFARAIAYGWPRGSTPPKYVWWEIVHELCRVPAQEETEDGNS